MQPPFIRAVLFDLGGTLMYAKGAWPPILARAAQALADALRAQGLDVDCEIIHHEFKGRLNEYYTRRDQDLFETTYTSVLRGLLADKGYTDAPSKILRGALDAMYAVTQSNWALADDAVSTLKTLQARGYRLGIVSNAGDNKDVFQLVNKFGIEFYFDFILTSAACSYRKPHPRIFEVALAHWKIPPREAAMVGDTLEADIAGANKLGIYSIWISRRTDPPKSAQGGIRPRATISALRELPDLLANP